MGNKVSRSDFEWTDQEEPHAKRRIEILSKTSISAIVCFFSFVIQSGCFREISRN